MISFSLGIQPTRGTEGFCDNSAFSFCRNFHTVLYNAPTSMPKTTARDSLFSHPPTHFFWGNSDLNGCKVAISQCFRLSFPWWCVILGILCTTITHRNKNKEKCHLWRIVENVGIWMAKWEKSGWKVLCKLDLRSVKKVRTRDQGAKTCCQIRQQGRLGWALLF